MNVIALAGKPGAGSSTVTKAIRYYPGTVALSFGDFLRKHGKSDSNLQDFGSNFLKKHGAGRFVEMLLGDKRFSGCSALIIDGVRHGSVWDAIQERFPNSQLFCMDQPTPALIETLTEREKIETSEAVDRLKHPVEQEFASLMTKANYVVRQSSADQLVDSTLREIIAIIDPSIVPGDIRARLHRSSPPTAEEKQAARKTNLLSDALSKGRREVFRLLLAEGGCVSAEEIADMLKIRASDVNLMEESNRLISVKRPEGKFEFPVWQLSGGTVIKGLPKVLSALSEHNDVAKLRFFLNGNLHLGGMSPLMALRNGRLNDVLVAARAYFTQGAA